MFMLVWSLSRRVAPMLAEVARSWALACLAFIITLCMLADFCLRSNGFCIVAVPVLLLSECLSKVLSLFVCEVEGFLLERGVRFGWLEAMLS